MESVIDVFDLDETDLKEQYDITDQVQRRRVYKQLGITKEQNWLQNEMQNKPLSVLREECSNMDCNGIPNSHQSGQSINIDNIQCAPLRRIRLILGIYHKLIQQSTVWNTISIAAMLQPADYGHQQLIDDFLHFQRAHSLQSVSMDNGDDEKSDLTVEHMLCQWFQKELPCNHQCVSLRKHKDSRNQN